MTLHIVPSQPCPVTMRHCLHCHPHISCSPTTQLGPPLCQAVGPENGWGAPSGPHTKLTRILGAKPQRAHVTAYVNRLKAGSQEDNCAIQRLGFPLVLLEGSLVIASFGLLGLAKNWM